MQLENYDNLAFKTFIRGLSGQLQNNIRLRNPNSLEQAMFLVIEEENFLQYKIILNRVNDCYLHQIISLIEIIIAHFNKELSTK